MNMNDPWTVEDRLKTIIATDTIDSIIEIPMVGVVNTIGTAFHITMIISTLRNITGFNRIHTILVNVLDMKVEGGTTMKTVKTKHTYANMCNSVFQKKDNERVN